MHKLMAARWTRRWALGLALAGCGAWLGAGSVRTAAGADSPPMVGDFHALDRFGTVVFGDDKGAVADAGKADAGKADGKKAGGKDDKPDGKKADAAKAAPKAEEPAKAEAPAAKDGKAAARAATTVEQTPEQKAADGKRKARAASMRTE